MTDVDRITIRPLAARDSFAELTELLHRAYAPLATRGMNFTAATQEVALTRKRAAEGQCYVADAAGRMVGTVTVAGPYDEATAPWSIEAPWYRDPDTAHFHQFAVDPSMQGRGLGRRLVAQCEAWARERRFRWIALDTAEPAAELRSLYRRLGYAEVGTVQWQGKTYRSVAMRKTLNRAPLREQLEMLGRYDGWATRRLLHSVDRLADEPYRRDVGLFFKSVHGTLNHLLLAGQEVWAKRLRGEPVTVQALNQEIEADRARLRQRLIDGALVWQPLLDGISDERLLGSLEYRRTDGAPVELPLAAALAHVFNHATHHRGQISAALTQLGLPAPELDLARQLQLESQGVLE